MSMDGMSMSMTDMPMTAAAMPSATSTPMDMSGHGGATTSMMGMSSMAMTFFSASTTPLYSTAWTPHSLGKYAGTCIFLIIFAAVFRAMLALRINFVAVQAALKQRRRGGAAFDAYSDDLKTTKPTGLRPWRAQEAVVFATMDVVLAGIGYLLMIAVMTMNVGYFLSVLGGVFLGSLVFGRFMAYSAAH